MSEIASNDEKNVFPRSFFDGLGLLKSSAALVGTSKRSDAKRRKTRPSTGSPPNLGTGEPARTIIPALAAALFAETKALKDAAGASRSYCAAIPSRLKERRSERIETGAKPKRRAELDVSSKFFFLKRFQRRKF